ncbi:hypothetical protein [Planctomicrobium sp. SH664]|uniref:hypothetical protein n=1 Tax=Planctomicrobium sp. SH664 TaxID=3448125 RepID=UPI003F5BFDDA
MMFRLSPWIRLSLALAVTLPGCAGLFAKQAIEQFAKSLEEQDLDKLKKSTSADFEEKALRQDDALKGLKVLKLPVGKVDEIVSDETLPDGKRKVIAKIGEKNKTKEIEYRLIKDSKSGKWVVDDIIMKQDSGGGVLVERSVTEQMDLLLTCRELLIRWRTGEREEQLKFCDDSLKSSLASLPPVWLDRMSKDIVGTSKGASFKPDARLKGSQASVIVPSSNGSLYLDMRRENEEWRLHDLALEPSSKDGVGIRSISKMSKALNQAATFLNGYASGDRDVLQSVATSSFYKQCLAVADLKQIPLPVEGMLAETYEARQFGRQGTDPAQSTERTELLLRNGKETFMLTLRPEEVALANGTKGQAEILVDEVTLFEPDGNEVKRMSAMFLAHDVVRLYIAALRDRDVARLNQLSTSDFKDRVWMRPEASHFAVMPDPVIAPGEPEILATVFRGQVSEVTIAQGETPMTLVLNSARGWMSVDDVIIPSLNRPTSLKANLEALLSVHAFAAAVHRRDLNKLILTSADGLDRIVWKQLAEPPELIQQVVHPLLAEVVSISATDVGVNVQTSDGETNAQIKLIREGQHYVVHDVSLVTVDGSQRMDLLQTLRQMLATGELRPVSARRPGSPTVTVEHARPAPIHPQQAAFEPIDPAVYTQTVEATAQPE